MIYSIMRAITRYIFQSPVVDDHFDGLGTNVLSME
jgi:hypothetical protein